MSNQKNFLLVVGFLLIVSLIAFRPYIGGQNSEYATEIAAAGLGTVLAAFVTFVLLQSQSRNEESKEKGVAIYQTKLETYNSLMDALEEAMCQGQPKEAARNKLRFQAFRTRFIAHDTVVHQLEEFSKTYNELVQDNEFSDTDWDMSRDSVIALVNAMRADLEADRKGIPLIVSKRDGATTPVAGSTSGGAQPNITVASEQPTQEVSESSDFTPQISKSEFLAQCEESEKPYFSEVLAYCESHPTQIVIDWGSKGFSVKDKNKRQILWMFPKAGANSKSNINARTQKLTPEEKSQVESILRANGIASWSWRPAQLPFSEVKKIINLVCGI